MANSAIQLLGFTLALVGFVGLITSTVMPEWKISSYAGANIVTAQAIYEGLWMSCVSQSTGQIQCQVFDSLLQLSTDMQVTRALMITSIILSGIALLVSMFGLECTICLAEDKKLKRKVVLTGGILYIIAGICALVATSWYGNKIAAQFYDPLVSADHRYEFGNALFTGWAASFISVLGGAFLCCNCVSTGLGQSVLYPRPNSLAKPGTDYV